MLWKQSDPGVLTIVDNAGKRKAQREEAHVERMLPVWREAPRRDLHADAPTIWILRAHSRIA